MVAARPAVGSGAVAFAGSEFSSRNPPSNSGNELRAEDVAAVGRGEFACNRGFADTGGIASRERISGNSARVRAAFTSATIADATPNRQPPGVNDLRLWRDGKLAREALCGKKLARQAAAHLTSSAANR